MKQIIKYLWMMLSFMLLLTATTTAQNRWVPIMMGDMTTFVPCKVTITLTPNQRYTADQIISIFENNTTTFRYDYAEVVKGDEVHGITAGRLGFTSATGDMLAFFQSYYHHTPFLKYIEELERLEALFAEQGYEVSNKPDGSMNVANLGGLIEDWHNEGKKQAFQKAQDKYLEENYYIPAIKVANDVGLSLPLSLLCFYDTAVQHGVDGLKDIVSQVNLAYPTNKEEELKWIKQFNQKRVAVLKSKSYWKDTLYRVETLNDLLKDKKYYLNIDKIVIRAWGNQEFVLNHTQKSKNTIHDVSASSTDTQLTLVMNGAFVEGSHGSFFIDADNDSSTGYSGGTVKGADYLIQHTAIYRYPDNAKGWKWDKISSEAKTETTTSKIISKVPLNMIDIGDDTIQYIGAVSMPNWENRINYKQMKEHKMFESNNENRVVIGARPVKATPLSKGTLFASADGDGDCSKEDPCDIYMAFNRLKAGDVLFLRGGVYKSTKQLLVYKKGTKEKPVTIESYPGEWAVIDGPFDSHQYKKEHKNQKFRWVGIKVIGEYARIRRLEVKQMGNEGIVLLYASHNVVEGCKLHDNSLPGITAYGGEWHEDSEEYVIPYKFGYNIIRDNIAYNNSDVGFEAKTANGKPADGGNADGIAVSSGKHNQVIHNTVYGNSDDGIDTWRSNDSYVAYNLVYDNGRAQGDGNGIKAGGNINPDAGNGMRAVVEHNIVFNNRANGFDYNVGQDVVFRYNTSYGNKKFGFKVGKSTTMEHNIASANIDAHNDGYVGKNNSWSIADSVEFISTDPKSNNFLKPKDEAFKNMGAYANLPENQNNNNSKIKIFVIGDSTTYSKGTYFDKENTFPKMGWAEREAFGTLLKSPENLFDEGRSGASSKSYKIVLDNAHDWEETKELIRNTDISHGAYLFIQFGHNDEKGEHATTLDEFYIELKEYVDWAKTQNNLTPILITPVERRQKSEGNNNHQTHKEEDYYGDYQQVVKNVANDTGVTLLDLQHKSWLKYNTYKDTNDINKDLANEASGDITHFSPEGAKIVAGWVKELICEKEEKLCSVFK